MVARARWQALGTTAELLVLGDRAQLTRARAALQALLDRVDLACSRFRPDSELTQLNRAEGRPMRVSPLLLEAVEVALRAARLTDGDVDPTLGLALEIAGYDCDWELIANAEDEHEEKPDGPACERGGERGHSLAVELGRLRAAAQRHPSPRVRAVRRERWQAVRVDRGGATVQLPPGVKLDLGASAKAWAADLGAAGAAGACGGGVLVSLGGDIATAGPTPADGWLVHVTDDHRSGPDAPGQTVLIRTGGLATSSTTVRRWRRDDGKRMHHIIDPATEAPTRSPWRTVSVAAATCADANVAATAAIVRGERAPRWLAGRGLPARLVAHDGSVELVGAWPSERSEAVVA